ncbi:rhomboid family intramembrane serine protease [Bacillaceae bacterium S4-13-58]
MYIKEHYLFWKITYDLVVNQGFEILKLEQNPGVLWLEKEEKKTTYLIRATQQTFDWSNQWKQDIERSFRQTQQLENLLLGKNIRFLNVYISEFPPVDQWEDIQIPLEKKGKKTIVGTTYLITDENREEEISKLYQVFNGSYNKLDIPVSSEEVLIEQIQYMQQTLFDIKKQKDKEVKDLFQTGRPLITYALITLNVILFFLLEFTGGSTNTLQLVQFGAKYNPAILEGEWWRIISSMFLHIGWIHIAMNMLALYYLGMIVERMYKGIRFIIIYFLAGIVGGIASFSLTVHVAAGASGAIFGLFGALLFFGVVHRKLFFRTMGRNVLFILVINLLLGFSVPQIDMSAHIGGLVGGFLAAQLVHFPKMKHVWYQTLAGIALVLIAGGLSIYGFSDSREQLDIRTELDLTQNLIQQERFEKAESLLTRDIAWSPDTLEFYFFRGYVRAQLDEIDLAIEDYEKVIKEDNQDIASYYYLSLLYIEKGDQSEAQEMVNRAKEIDPNHPDIQKVEQYLNRVDELN